MLTQEQATEAIDNKTTVYFMGYDDVEGKGVITSLFIEDDGYQKYIDHQMHLMVRYLPKQWLLMNGDLI